MRGDVQDARKQRLVHSAKAAFAQGGVSGTSVSQIVQQAGVARGTFYQYFDNKLHIFQSILDSFLHDLNQCVRPISLTPGSSSPLAQIEENLNRVLGLVLSERELTQILMQRSGSLDPVVEKRLADFYQQVTSMIEHSLKVGIAMRLVRPCNTRLTAYAIVGAVKEVVFQVTSADGPHPRIEELVQDLLEFGVGGILAQSGVSTLETRYRTVLDFLR